MFSKTLQHKLIRNIDEFLPLISGYSSITNRLNPVIVYQMGKVGSSTFTNTLINLGISPILQVHYFNHDHPAFYRQKYTRTITRLYQTHIAEKKPTKFITLVRDPISRNISAFFQTIEVFVYNEDKPYDMPIDSLTRQFLDNYPHETPLQWFDDELRKMIGIDVYVHEFPKRDSWQVIRQGSFELLIIKAELSDQRKTEVMCDFLGISNVTLSESNRGDRKIYKETYKAFCNSVQLPQSYVNRLLDSKYTRHFYTEEEIEYFKKNWLDFQ